MQELRTWACEESLCVKVDYVLMLIAHSNRALAMQRKRANHPRNLEGSSESENNSVPGAKGQGGLLVTN